jgi:hypothetical protein
VDIRWAGAAPDRIRRDSFDGLLCGAFRFKEILSALTRHRFELVSKRAMRNEGHARLLI